MIFIIQLKAGPRKNGYMYNDDNDSSKFEIVNVTKYKTKDIWNMTKEEFIGYETAIQVKATGEVYFARFAQTQPVYNDTLCRTLVYSFMPTVLQ